MAFSLDGTPVVAQPGDGSTSYNIGPLTTVFVNGEVFIVHECNGGAGILNISGGGLSFTKRANADSGGGNLIFELWAAPVGGAIVNNVTFSITLPSGGSGITTALFAVSDAGNPVAFDAGGPQTAITGAASMTTSETAFVLCCARFNSTSAPTASSPWNGIISGVANAFMAVEYQLASVGTYTGLFSGTDENGSIIDALYASPPPVSLLTATVLMPATWM